MFLSTSTGGARDAHAENVEENVFSIFGIARRRQPKIHRGGRGMRTLKMMKNLRFLNDFTCLTTTSRAVFNISDGPPTPNQVPQGMAGDAHLRRPPHPHPHHRGEREREAATTPTPTPQGGAGGVFPLGGHHTHTHTTGAGGGHHTHTTGAGGVFPLKTYGNIGFSSL